MYRSQLYATAIYRAHLAEKLQALGYEIRVDPRTGAPEIKGFSPDYLQDSSPRRKEVLTEEGKMKERMEREGKTISDNKQEFTNSKDNLYSRCSVSGRDPRGKD